MSLLIQGACRLSSRPVVSSVSRKSWNLAAEQIFSTSECIRGSPPLSTISCVWRARNCSSQSSTSARDISLPVLSCQMSHIAQRQLQLLLIIRMTTGRFSSGSGRGKTWEGISVGPSAADNEGKSRGLTPPPNSGEPWTQQPANSIPRQHPPPVQTNLNPEFLEHLPGQVFDAVDIV